MSCRALFFRNACELVNCILFFFFPRHYPSINLSENGCKLFSFREIQPDGNTLVSSVLLERHNYRERERERDRQREERIE